MITKERLLQPAAGLALLDFALADAQPHNERNEHQEGAAHKGCPCTPMSDAHMAPELSVVAALEERCNASDSPQVNTVCLLSQCRTDTHILLREGRPWLSAHSFSQEGAGKDDTREVGEG